MTNSYSVGQLVRLSAAFTVLQEDGVTYAAADPSTVLFYCRQPDGTVVDLEYGVDGALKRDGVGLYHADIQTPVSGEYTYRMAGTGQAETAGEGSFYVRPTYTTPHSPPPAP